MMNSKSGLHLLVVCLLVVATDSVASNPNSNRLFDSTGASGGIHARGEPIGPGPNCTAITSYAEKTANVTILSPNGTVIGGDSHIQLPKKGWYNVDSRLPWTLAMKLEKHNNLLLQYSNDKPWVVQPQTTSRNVFDCRQFKFWLITNFWTFEERKYWDQGTLNWTILALDGTKLGGSPQADLLAQSMGADYPAASLPSMLDEIIDVYWSTKNGMTFKYGSQKISLSNATGAHVNMLVGSAPMNTFAWTTSGIL